MTGDKDYQCTPWGNPTRNVFGWQKPCYLMSDGYAKTFKELMETTEWDNYGTGRDPRCADCMVHCGYEPTAVLDSTANLKNMWKSFTDALGLSRQRAGEAAGPSGRPSVQYLPVLHQHLPAGRQDSVPASAAPQTAEEDREAVGAGQNN